MDQAGEREAEDVAAAHERLSVQREVVDAVLAMDEPYRGVVLLHHFEGQSIASIARRRGVSQQAPPASRCVQAHP